jgi:NitT/TauT family transport system ATP-binding protein
LEVIVLKSSAEALKLDYIQDIDSAEAKISVHNVNHYFNSSRGKTTKALENVTLHIKDHEFVAIVGPSGCGKSTLLNIMAGLVKPTEGEILIDGEKSEGINTKISYLSQADALLPWRTVIENVELGLEIKKISKEERRKSAKELIERTGLSGFEDSYPSELSGGMRKRVSICRTLALEPEVLFMDEPFGPLDVFTKEVLQEDILKLWQETKKTIVFVTHDIGEAITLADKVVLMTARPSKIKAVYDIPLPRPRSVVHTRFDKEFIKLHKLIWDELRGELVKARDGEINEGSK